MHRHITSHDIVYELCLLVPVAETKSDVFDFSTSEKRRSWPLARHTESLGLLAVLVYSLPIQI